MTLVDEIEKWNAKWKRDWPWRQKHNIAFGSKEHRESNQVDIAFEYIESNLYNQAINGLKKEEEKKKKLQETGMWISESKMEKSEEDKLWESMELTKIK